jgi:hypothetical protein
VFELGGKVDASGQVEGQAMGRIGLSPDARPGLAVARGCAYLVGASVGRPSVNAFLIGTFAK